jgi:hypothetical protein
MSLYLAVFQSGSNHVKACPFSVAPALSAAATVALPELAIARSLIVNQTPPPKKLKQSRTSPTVGTRPKRLHAGRYPWFFDPDRLLITKLLSWKIEFEETK